MIPIQRTEGSDAMVITDHGPAEPVTGPIEGDQDMAAATFPKGTEQELDDQMPGHEHQSTSFERRQFHGLDAGR
jgi:hypothetical protein